MKTVHKAQLAAPQRRGALHLLWITGGATAHDYGSKRNDASPGLCALFLEASAKVFRLKVKRCAVPLLRSRRTMPALKVEKSRRSLFLNYWCMCVWRVHRRGIQLIYDIHICTDNDDSIVGNVGYNASASIKLN